jgi:hypothetical protein
MATGGIEPSTLGANARRATIAPPGLVSELNVLDNKIKLL